MNFFTDKPRKPTGHFESLSDIAELTGLKEQILKTPAAPLNHSQTAGEEAMAKQPCTNPDETIARLGFASQVRLAQETCHSRGK